MILCDVNVLVYAFRADASGHAKYREWLENVVNSDQAFGVSEAVLAGFLRIVTHPKIFNPPAPIEEALAFAQALKSQPHCVLITPGPNQWDIFTRLCKAVGAKGNYVADAYLAALAIQSGCEWITTDRDYSRFPGLKWRHPLE